jgi:SAM-dependent methyltransferase
MRLKNFLPVGIRRCVRRGIREFPVRLRDLPLDALDLLRPSECLPPAKLRFDVAGSSDRHMFRAVGSQAAREIDEALSNVLNRPVAGTVLDFGCGCGRVARPLSGLWPEAKLHGVDVDTRAIEWCRSHLSGDYRVLNQPNRLPFADGCFDVVYAISVFTHMNDEEQFIWLSEAHRVLRPNGWLLATTHSPALAYARPDLSEQARETLSTKGFVFAAGPRFNDNSAFHSAEYLQREWGRWFKMTLHQPYGLVAYQDLAIYSREASAA